jgi:hypothetical protein
VTDARDVERHLCIWCQKCHSLPHKQHHKQQWCRDV